MRVQGIILKLSVSLSECQFLDMLFHLFVNVYFVDFTGVTLFRERPLAHTQDNLGTAVVENQQVVCQWING